MERLRYWRHYVAHEDADDWLSSLVGKGVEEASSWHVYSDGDDNTEKIVSVESVQIVPTEPTPVIGGGFTVNDNGYIKFDIVVKTTV